METDWRAIPDPLVQHALAYLDSFTLRRLAGVSRWFRDAIMGSESLWRALVTARFPMMTTSDDFYRIHRRIDQDRLQLYHFGGMSHVKQFYQHPDSALRIPAYRLIKSVACGGYFFVVHTINRNLVVFLDSSRQSLLTGVDEYRCGRKCLFVRSGHEWFCRRNVIDPRTRLHPIEIPDRIRRIECGWEHAVILTAANELLLFLLPDETLVSVPDVPPGVDLIGSGESALVVANAAGLYEFQYDQRSWTLLYSFRPDQTPIQLKVWFRSVAVQTRRGWVARLPRTDRFAELDGDVRDVHLGDWHYVFVMGDGRLWSGGDYCCGGNLASNDQPVPAPVTTDWLEGGIALQYSCGGWQTLILYLD